MSDLRGSGRTGRSKTPTTTKRQRADQQAGGEADQPEGGEAPAVPHSEEGSQRGRLSPTKGDERDEHLIPSTCSSQSIGLPPHRTYGSQQPTADCNVPQPATASACLHETSRRVATTNATRPADQKAEDTFASPLLLLLPDGPYHCTDWTDNGQLSVRASVSISVRRSNLRHIRWGAFPWRCFSKPGKRGGEEAAGVPVPPARSKVCDEHACTTRGRLCRSSF